MAQQKGALVENTFGQGFVTEASGLNFPKDAAYACANVQFNQDMTVTRRPGLGFETGNINNAIPPTGAIAQYTWKNVANISDLQFAVFQVGTKIAIYKLSNPYTVSTQLLLLTDLEPSKQAGAPSTANLRCQFTEGNGNLYIAHPYCDPFEVKYGGGTMFTFTQFPVIIRDLQGINDGTAIDARYTTLTYTHLYNLYNQGWYAAAPVGNSKDTIGGVHYVLPYWHDTQGNYPANIDYWWSGKDALGQMNQNYAQAKALGNSPAPKGHYKILAFNQDRLTQTDVSSSFNLYNLLGSPSDIAPTTASYFRPSVITFFAGRIFLAGVNYNNGVTNYGNQIYFSRIIERPEHIQQYYQDADPTAEEGSDLLPSDGGVIVAPEIGTIYKLFPMGYSLIVFASNGVWSITGSANVGFSAKDYTIAKISSQGCLSDSTFVDLDGAPCWWSTTSINTLGSTGESDQGTSAGASVHSLTDKAIKRFFVNIRNTAKYYAQGTFNRETNTIMWCYNSTGVSSEYLFTDALVLNVNTAAWTYWSLPLTAPITAPATYYVKGFPAVTKFLVQANAGAVTFSEFNRTDFYDYGTTDYLSFVETGQTSQGQSMTRMWTPYVYIYLDGSVSNSALNFYHKWGYSASPDTGEYSNVQQVFTTQNYELETQRRKVRGSGRAVKIRFESLSGQPFVLVGWAMLTSVNGGP